MLAFISHVFQVIMDIALELLIYMFVDVFTKNTLRDISEVSEKRNIWLVEVGVLTVFGGFVLLVHHTPYILALLTFLTFAYTQLLERVNFRYWWVNLGTKWEEFQQHEESMDRLTKMNSQQSQRNWAPNGGWSQPTPHQPVPQMQTTYMTNDASMQHSEAWYSTENKRQPIPMQNESPGIHSFTMPATRQRVMHMTPTTQQMYGRMPEYMVQNTPPNYVYSTVPRGRELVRPPLHPHGQVAKATHQSQSIKNRFMSVLGMKTHSTVPAGLRNNGENICFMNSVLQCLAHSPGLALGLSQNQEPPAATSAQVALIAAVTELLETLAKAPTNTPLVNTDCVRQAASTFPCTMVAHPKQVQHQQDAAEFLMWLLDALHSSLDISGRTQEDQKKEDQSASKSWITPRYSSAALNMLRFIYGDLTAEKIKELKAECRKEIAMAGGVDVRGYAEAVQRLSDLEWLTYKETAQSIIDDMFVGQIVEALHCRSCSRLTVDIQTFNILPVPITRPRSLNGLVRLEDCLSTFGTVEELLGPEGLRCECCNRKQSPGGDGVIRSSTTSQMIQGSGSLGASPILPNGITRIQVGDTVRRRKLGSDSAIYSPSSVAMSPIGSTRSELLNDSGFQDHGQGPALGLRTSTPIAPAVPVRLTDGQRRSLLRQVPECLIIQLLRFTYAGGQPIKVHQPVMLPLTGLDLTPQIVDTVIQRTDVTAQAATHRYDLYGLCLHLGADVTASGHYISYARTADGEWYKYDDEHVVPVNMDYELTTRQVRENAYLTFYRRSNHS